MYDNTIKNNDVEKAAKELGIHDFITSLPNSYEYILGERGITLSVGQRQLIAFLRVYIRNPKIIILDEATSSIDSESEELLQAALKKMSINRTIIIIAHRLSTITGADKIILLEKGNIIESGNHQTLIDLNGKYFEMYSKQKNMNL
jgi:ABC-type multidrug transport system fused ATPase/permease subunit